MAQHYTVWRTTTNVSKELRAYILHPDYQIFFTRLHDIHSTKDSNLLPQCSYINWQT